MAPSTLDTTIVDGTNGQSSNAYIDVAYADQYHEDRLHSNAAWTAVSTDDKTSAILWATRIIDARFDFIGRKAYHNQALEWPRWETLDDDGYLIGWNYTTSTFEYPKQLQDGVAEFAYQLTVSDRTADTASGGLSELRVDVIGLKFLESQQVDEIPEAVKSILLPIGSVIGHPKGGASTVSLVRV